LSTSTKRLDRHVLVHQCT